MRVRSAQLAALRRAHQEDLVRRFTRHIRETDIEASGLPPALVAARVRWAVQSALGHGLESPELVLRFVAMAFRHGPPIAREVREILFTSGWPPERRLEEANRYLAAQRRCTPWSALDAVSDVPAFVHSPARSVPR